jgi:uncharacterized protein (TIGR02594 family)
MHRRIAVGQLSAHLVALLSGWVPHAYATESSDRDYVDYHGDLPDDSLPGNETAMPQEEKQARALIDGAPCGSDALTVAKYFETIKVKNRDQEAYNAAWSRRWNPVIVTFYRSSRLSKEYILQQGDRIPWCAAFMNWCLACAGSPSGQSASSSCFRTYGISTDVPRAGDIVVFMSANQSKADKGAGHVGFFLEQNDHAVHVLGGNQTGGKSYSSVCQSWIPKHDEKLILHSYRKISLRRS